MIKDVVENSVWTKTQALILDKYGKKISFKSIGLSQGKSDFYQKGDDIIIPLNSYSSVLGEVIVQRGCLLSAEQRHEIIDLVKFLIEPHVYNKHLILKEESQISSKEIKRDNVYSLFSDNDNDDESLIKLISNIIHLKSASETVRKKIALKIHEMAEQNLFIGFSEISQQVTGPEDLNGLEKTTIYIEDIMKLSVNQLKLLSTITAGQTSGLVFIFGSSVGEAELESLDLAEHLKKDLSAILFDIDRVPLSQQTSTDVLELLFFNVDQIGSS